MLCNDSANTAQKNGDRGKRTNDQARTRGIHSFEGTSAMSHWPQLQILRLPLLFVPVAFVPLSSNCLGPTSWGWTVWCSGSYTCLHRTSYKHGETETVSIVQQRFAGLRYTLVAHWANYHHITQYQPQGIGPKRSLDSSTPATSTKGDGGWRIRRWDRWPVADTPRKCVGPGFEPGRWSFFPCRHSSEQCFLNHDKASHMLCLRYPCTKSALFAYFNHIYCF